MTAEFERVRDRDPSAAASAAVPDALAAARAEDEAALTELCRRDMTFALGSESELAALRRAVEPVYVELRADPETRSAIDAITDMKARRQPRRRRLPAPPQSLRPRRRRFRTGPTRRP